MVVAELLPNTYTQSRKNWVIILPECTEIEPALRLSGLEPFTMKDQQTSFLMVGERTNVTGSPRFKKLIEAEDYESALKVAKQQVENGANVIDVNFDAAMLDGRHV